MEASTLRLERDGRPGVHRVVWLAVRDQWPFLAVAAVYVAVVFGFHLATGVPPEVARDVSWATIGLMALLYFVPAFFVVLAWGLIREGRSLLSAATWKHAWLAFFSPGRFAAFFVLFLVIPPFINTFVAVKTSIPLVQPYAWDARFMQWEQWLHFGRHPYELLQPLIGHPAVTNLLDRVYYTWFPVVWLTLVWQMWHGDRFSENRQQFLMCFALCWIVLGSLSAMLLSSAGPVYYPQFVDGPDPYAPLMEYLRGVDGSHGLMALAAQDALWASYADPTAEAIGEGISAMPSMHVSMVTLCALIGFKVNRWVGWAYAAFALAIMVGSVHLAWHYAIDGYVSIAATWGLWWVSGRWA